MRYVLLLAGLTIVAVVYAAAAPAQDKDKEPAVKEPAEKEPDTTADDIKTLRDVGLGADSPALLEYFRKRTYREADPKRLEALIRELGDDDFPVREKAYAELTQLGTSALVAVKQAAESAKDTETRRRALDLKTRIEAKQEPAIQIATARMVARLKPAGAADVLLNYLPFAADRAVTDELCKALSTVAVDKGKVDPAVSRAAEDKLPVKRGAAGEALARAKVANELPTVRKLLKDSDPSVRLRVAMALVPQHDKDVISVLIDLLQHLSPDELWQAEEVLVRLAGEQAPTVPLGTNEVARKACHEAWAAWFKENPKVDLARLDEPTALLGYTLVVQQGNRFMGGRLPAGQVMELDREKKEKWKFEVPTYPVDAQVVGRDRVLIAEYQGSRVTERDFKGNVQWEQSVPGNPIGVQRLPDGNTLVVLQQSIVEYDRNHKQVYTYQKFNDNIFRARKLRNGHILMVSGNGTLTHLDPKANKEVKSFFVGHPNNLFGGFDVLPNGNVVVPQQNNNRVAEFTMDGKEVGGFNVQQPNSVMRLPNGHLIVSSNNTRRVVELDRTGREVWVHQITDGTPFNARRR